MSKQEIIICDGCGKEISSEKDRYKLRLESGEFWNGYDDYDKVVIELDFCEDCARDIKHTLEKIAAKLGDSE